VTSAEVELGAEESNSEVVEVDVFEDVDPKTGIIGAIVAVVQSFASNWHLITATGGDQSYQVSVGNDGLIRLPHSIEPRQVPVFVKALEEAAGVGAQVIADNQASKPRPGGVIGQHPGAVSYRNNIVVTEGPAPAGTVPVSFSSKPNLGRR